MEHILGAPSAMPVVNRLAKPAPRYLQRHAVEVDRRTGLIQRVIPSTIATVVTTPGSLRAKPTPPQRF